MSFGNSLGEVLYGVTDSYGNLLGNRVNGDQFDLEPVTFVIGFNLFCGHLSIPFRLGRIRHRSRQREVHGCER